MTKLKHHEFKATQFEDDNGPAVMFEQSDGWDGDEPQTVILHPSQLREVCERFGILTADPKAEREIATLRRRMLTLRAWILDLEDYMQKHSDHKHADLSHEMGQLGALAELAEEWCLDFEATDAPPKTQADTPGHGTDAAPAIQAALI